MALPNEYQNGSIDSAVKGVYRASPVKLMIYGNGSALQSNMVFYMLMITRDKQPTFRRH
jgi:hypothetical protein